MLQSEMSDAMNCLLDGFMVAFNEMLLHSGVF